MVFARKNTYISFSWLNNKHMKRGLYALSMNRIDKTNVTRAGMLLFAFLLSLT